MLEEREIDILGMDSEDSGRGGAGEVTSLISAGH